MMKLISFEGSDYSGKTTTAKLLAEKLSKNNSKIVYNSGSIYSGEELAMYKEISLYIDDSQREAFYTSAFFLDKKRLDKSDDRIILQDRYWMSVVAYGRFLNKEKSLHQHVDLSKWMIKPDAIIYLQCSAEEKIRRSNLRNSKSVLDRYLLKNPEEINKLEYEIKRTLKSFDKIFSLDTTGISISDVTEKVENYLLGENLL